MVENSGDIDNPQTWKEKGNELFNQGEYQKAIECFAHAIELDPEYLPAWNNLGYTLLKMGKIEEAKNVNKKIKELKNNLAKDIPGSSHIDRPSAKESLKSPLITDKEDLQRKYENGEISYDEYAKSSNRKRIASSRTTQKKSIAGSIIFFIIIVFFLIVAVAAFNWVFTDTETPSKSSSKSIQEVKNEAISPSYDDLFRNNEEYVGDIVYYKGSVVQVENLVGDEYVLRVSTRPFYEDILYVLYKGQRLLEDDTVEFWGEVNGLKTYTAILGNSVTVPEIDCLYLNLATQETSTVSVSSYGLSTTIPTTPRSSDPKYKVGMVVLEYPYDEEGYAITDLKYSEGKYGVVYVYLDQSGEGWHTGGHPPTQYYEYSYIETNFPYSWSGIIDATHIPDRDWSVVTKVKTPVPIQCSIVGQWVRTGGADKYVFYHDGTSMVDINGESHSGTWVELENSKTYRFYWDFGPSPGQPNYYDDHVVLSSDCNRYTLTNNYGNTVTAIRQDWL